MEMCAPSIHSQRHSKGSAGLLSSSVLRMLRVLLRLAQMPGQEAVKLAHPFLYLKDKDTVVDSSQTEKMAGRMAGWQRGLISPEPSVRVA